MGAEHDRQVATDLASYANGSERAADAYLRWRVQVAEDMVTTKLFRRLAAAVSAELLERERLSGRAVLKSVRQRCPSMTR